jgi:hypothetical protein
VIALGDTDEDARAIVDFADAATLISALRRWRWEHPEERVLIFDGRGALIARHQPMTVPQVAAASAQGRFHGRALALGGAR